MPNALGTGLRARLERPGWPFGKTRSAALPALALAFALAACSNDLESLYRPTTPALPSLPDPDRVAECEACAVEHCAEVRNRCLEIEACSALLTCRGACSDPTCTQRCVADHHYSPSYDDLWACVLQDSCAEACGSGENFACVDRYEAPKAEKNAERFPVRFRFKNPRTGLAYAYPGDQRDEQFVVGAAARSCPPPKTADSVCQPIQSGVVDVRNSVELDVVVDQYTRYFTGVIEVEREDQGEVDAGLFRQLGWRDRYLPPFFAQATEFRFYVFWRGWIREALIERPNGPPDFATAAPIAIYFEDCMGAPARGVRLELLDLPSVEVMHQSADGSFNGEATDIGSALAGDIPEAARGRAITAQAVRIDNHAVVARRNEVYVRAGWTTHVWLVPSPAR
jgi:hypothetical protein